MNDLNEDNKTAEAGKQGWAELFHTQTNIKLYQITSNYKTFWNTNMKKDPPDHIIYSVQIALLNVYFPSRGLCEFLVLFQNIQNTAFWLPITQLVKKIQQLSLCELIIHFE